MMNLIFAFDLLHCYLLVSEGQGKDVWESERELLQRIKLVGCNFLSYFQRQEVMIFEGKPDQE